jgi:hypothetical protein
LTEGWREKGKEIEGEKGDQGRGEREVTLIVNKERRGRVRCRGDGGMQ